MINYIFRNHPLEFKSPIWIVDFGRNDLPRMFKALGFKSGAEIGVWKGDYSETLITRHPGLKLYLIDPWVEYLGGTKVKVKERIMDADQDVFDEVFKYTTQRMSEYPNVKIIRKSSEAAAAEIEDGSLDFVYIDGDHRLEVVLNDIITWSKKVRPGGVISGHDYNKPDDGNIFHVRHAVDAYTSAYCIKPWFVFGKAEDIHNSWMWVKDGR